MHEKGFSESVDDLRLNRIAELEQKLLKLEQFYEDILEQHERQEILRKQRKKSE